MQIPLRARFIKIVSTLQIHFALSNVLLKGNLGLEVYKFGGSLSAFFENSYVFTQTVSTLYG